MCFHVASPTSQQLRAFVHNEYQVKDFESFFHVSGFAFPPMPVLTADGEIRPMNWGLIPPWVKDEATANDIRSKTLNAKSETIYDLPSFKASAGSKRCIIFINGFFEWQHQGTETIPYYIYTDGQPFALAGLWSSWTNRETGEIHETCTIITTKANALMENIHNTKKRMPVVLQQEKWAAWLDNKSTKETILDLMQPLPEGILHAHKISKLITSRTQSSNVPEVQLPLK